MEFNFKILDSNINHIYKMSMYFLFITNYQFLNTTEFQ